MTTAEKTTTKKELIEKAKALGIEGVTKDFPVKAIEMLIAQEEARQKAEAKAASAPRGKTKAVKKGFDSPVVARAIKATDGDNAQIDRDILRAIITGTDIAPIEKNKNWVRARALHAIATLWNLGAFNAEFDQAVSQWFNRNV